MVSKTSLLALCASAVLATAKPSHLRRAVDQLNDEATREAHQRDDTATRAFSDVTIKTSDGRCLTIDELSGDFRANLTPVQLAECGGPVAIGQGWDVITAGKHNDRQGQMLVVSTLTQACLNFDPRRQPGNQLLLFSCGGRADGGGAVTDSQLFAFENSGAGPLSLKPFNVEGVCATAGAGEVLDAAPCDTGALNQLFVFGDNAKNNGTVVEKRGGGFRGNGRGRGGFRGRHRGGHGNGGRPAPAPSGGQGAPAVTPGASGVVAPATTTSAAAAAPSETEAEAGANGGNKTNNPPAPTGFPSNDNNNDNNNSNNAGGNGNNNGQDNVGRPPNNDDNNGGVDDDDAGNDGNSLPPNGGAGNNNNNINVNPTSPVPVSRAGGTLNPTAAAEANQFDPTAQRPKQSVNIRSADGRCLSVDPTAGDFRQNLIPVAMVECADVTSQKFDVVDKGAHNNGRDGRVLLVSVLTEGCVSFDPRRQEGDKVTVFSCGGRADGGGETDFAQLFPYDGSDSIVLEPQSSRGASCLIAGDERLDAANCNKGDDQKWDIVGVL
jgi:hypothetical protein